LDSLYVKESALRLAVDAALTVLRVDQVRSSLLPHSLHATVRTDTTLTTPLLSPQIIMAKQAGGPKPREGGAPDAD
jgi:hypothetical protein